MILDFTFDIEDRILVITKNHWGMEFAFTFIINMIPHYLSFHYRKIVVSNQINWKYFKRFSLEILQHLVLEWFIVNEVILIKTRVVDKCACLVLVWVIPTTNDKGTNTLVKVYIVLVS